MRIVREKQQKTMVWKNGGGQTIEMAIFPPEASLETFGWRLSRATIEKPGPFSVFPNVERSLTLLSGKGLALKFDNGPTLRLNAPGETAQLLGDVPITAEPIGGPVQDLNVMTRRGAFRHEVTVLSGKRTLDASLPENSYLALYADGPGKLVRKGASSPLAAGDLVELGAADLPVEVVPGTDARIIAIEIAPT